MPEPLEGVPEWLVERLVAHDLDAKRAEEVHARLAAKGELARLEQMEAANRASLAAHPSVVVVPEIERRLALRRVRDAERRRTRSRFAWPALAIAAPTLAAAATLLLLEFKSSDPVLAPPLAPSQETVTSKGLAPHLVLYKKVGSRVDRLTPVSLVRPGDVLQVAYVSLGYRYGVIASVDARGAVSLHLPEEPGQAAELSKQGEVPVPHAFELDDSPGFERFVFAVSETPFTTSMLVGALSSGTLEHVPARLELAEVVVRKEPHP
jgi:hypothetical protein